ncbi:MAG: HAD-IA family hydrolase [Pyramidobacter sp.]|nr:HAD-IA family hydrolase [Pyramidobacter sp.]
MALLSPCRADCIVFDVDGVLINGTVSFRAVVSKCIPLYWSDVLGLDADCDTDAGEYYMAAKLYSSYNNDYDLVWALLSLTAASGQEKLSAAFPSLEKWQAALAEAGSEGLAWFSRTCGNVVDRNIVQGVCTELYFGSADEREKKSFCGLLKQPVEPCRRLEKALFTTRWDKLPLPVGIYSGRYRNEIRAALETLGWSDFPSDRIVSVEMCRKPDPSGMKYLCNAMGCSWPLYLGDAESDRMVMKNFGRGDFIAIGPLLKNSAIRFTTAADALRAVLGVV